MRRIVGCVSVLILSLAVILPFSYCDTIKLDELIGEYSHATDIQRAQLAKHYIYQQMLVSSVIKDVQDWDVFNEATDKGKHYYRVTTEPLKTSEGTPYEIVIFYKDKNKVKDMNKGDKIELEATFLKILDQRLFFSAWFYGEEITPEEKEMFK